MHTQTGSTASGSGTTSVDETDDDVGIVIPAYRPDVGQLCAYIVSLESALDPAVIRVELDAPTDRETVRRIEATGATVNESPSRRGKGRAITAGFEALPADLSAYCFLDADGSTPPMSAAKVIRAVQVGHASLAVGSRRHPDATVTTHQTVLRRFLGDAFASIARLLLPISLHDYQCGAKAITPAGWDRVRSLLYEDGFGWDLELVAMAAAAGLKIEEVPIEWEDRPGSSVDLRTTVPDLLRTVIVVRHRAKAIRGNRLHSRLFPPRSPALVEDLRGDSEA